MYKGFESDPRVQIDPGYAREGPDLSTTVGGLVTTFDARRISHAELLLAFLLEHDFRVMEEFVTVVDGRLLRSLAEPVTLRFFSDGEVMEIDSEGRELDYGTYVVEFPRIVLALTPDEGRPMRLRSFEYVSPIVWEVQDFEPELAGLLDTGYPLEPQYSSAEVMKRVTGRQSSQPRPSAEELVAYEQSLRSAWFWRISGAPGDERTQQNTRVLHEGRAHVVWHVQQRHE